MKNKIKSIKSYFLKNKKASILAYSLIVVSVMIVIATSISVVTVIEKKGAVSTDASVQAYQTADSGVQMAIKEINKIISTGNSSSTSIGSVFANCVDPNSADGSIFAGAEYKLSFFSDEEGNTPIGCSATIDQIQSIKSVGTYKDTVRAVQVAVAANALVLYGGSYMRCEDVIGNYCSTHFTAKCVEKNVVTNDCTCPSGYTRRAISRAEYFHNAPWDTAYLGYACEKLN